MLLVLIILLINLLIFFSTFIYFIIYWMSLNIDNFFFYMLNNIYSINFNKENIFNSYILDLILNINMFENIYFTKNITYLSNSNLLFYIDCLFYNLIDNNTGYFLYTTNTNKFEYYSFNFFFFVKILLKLNVFFFVIYTMFFITNFENYIKQIKTINLLVKTFLLNSTEKEVGPLDDYFFFAILFILTISMFIFSSLILVLTQIKIFIWALGAFFLMTILILSIPVNLFIDFGIIFSSAVRGSASNNNFFKETVFDIISVLIVFIRFVIQNVRFLFIFSGIFELLEWCLSINNSMFFSSIMLNNNVFLNNILFNNFINLKNFNYLLVNSLLFIVLYFYYLLHLLFLLIVQVTVYISISIWLFFFLYSTKFLTKWDKFFVFKKMINWI